MKKLKYCGPEDHIVVFLEHGAVKFKKNEVKEVSDVFAPKVLAIQGHKFEILVPEEPKPQIQAEAKVLPARARNRQLPKAEVKDGSEL